MIKQHHLLAGTSTSDAVRATATIAPTCAECRGPLHESADGTLICVLRSCPAYGQTVEDEPPTETTHATHVNLIYLPPNVSRPQVLQTFDGEDSTPPVWWPDTDPEQLVPPPEDTEPDPAITISGTSHITVDGYRVQLAMSRADVLAPDPHPHRAARQATRGSRCF